MNLIDMNPIQSRSLREPTVADVTAAVMAALRELDGVGGRAGSSNVDEHAGLRNQAQPAAHSINATPAGTQAFSGSLLLERHVFDLPENTRELVTSPKTVITPLAREILKKKRISIRWAGHASWPGSSNRLSGQWAVFRSCDSQQSLAVEQSLAGRTGEGWELIGPGLENALNWLQGDSLRHIAVLAQVSCLMVWRLHQQGIRAAEVRQNLELERIARSFAPRCIVVEPARMPIHEARQIFHSWRQLGVIDPPTEMNDAGFDLGRANR